MLDLLSPPLIAVLALAAGAILIRKAWRKHNWAIFSASLPRLYLAGVYTWLSFYDAPQEQRQLTVRLAVVLLLFVEIINQLFNRRGVTYDRR